MKKLILLLSLVFAYTFGYSFASLPYTFLPRQLISAAKVMANYNALLNGFTNGANKIDIAELWVGSTLRIANDGDATLNDVTAATITADYIYADAGSISINNMEVQNITADYIFADAGDISVNGLVKVKTSRRLLAGVSNVLGSNEIMDDRTCSQFGAAYPNITTIYRYINGNWQLFTVGTGIGTDFRLNFWYGNNEPTIGPGASYIINVASDTDITYWTTNPNSYWRVNSFYQIKLEDDLEINGNITGVGDAEMSFNGSKVMNLSATVVSINGNVDLKGSAANIGLGSNYLSGDLGDEGLSIDSAGAGTFSAGLTIAGVTSANYIRSKFINSKSVTQDLVAGHTITVNAATIKIQGSGGAVDLTSNPQIAVGTYDGQILTVMGVSDTNTIKLDDGTGLVMEMDASFTMGLFDNIVFEWYTGTNVWVEKSRKDN